MADDIDYLDWQLEHNLAALYLRMRSILNISESAVQDVIQQVSQIINLSKPLLFPAIQRILLNYYPDADMSIASEIVTAISESNVILKHTQKGCSLSTSPRRASYMVKELKIVEPVEFVTDKHKKSIIYITVLKMLQTLLNKDEILDKALKVCSGDMDMGPSGMSCGGAGN